MKTGTFEHQSNTATWQFTVELVDDSDSEPIDLADVSAITIKLRDPATKSTVLSGSLSGGEVVAVGADADGTVQITFSATAMTALCPKTYEVGMLVTQDDGFVTQIILGSLPVIEGL